MADINEIISKAGIDSVTKTTAELQKTNEQIEAAIVNYKKLVDTMAGAKTMSGLNRDNQAAIKFQEQMLTLTARRELAEKKIAQFEEQAAAKRQASEAKQLASDQKQIDALDRKSKKITEQSRLYVQLSNQLEILRKNAQDVGVRFGENSVQFQKAAERVNVLDQRLKNIDKQLGKSQRFVGEYERAGGRTFNGLANSVNQLTREFPAFTFSVQTGFLALSNNIPIFFDQIQQTQREIAALRAEGKQVPGLFKQLTSTIFSFGTALSIGVTLLTVYGKEIGEFFGAMFKGKEAMDAFAERQRLINEALKGTDYTGAVNNVNELRINIDLARKGLLDKEKVLNQYNTTIGQTTGEVNNLDEAEKALVRNGDAFIKVTLLKAAAQLALDEAAKKSYEAEITRRKRLTEFSSFTEQFGSLEGINTATGEIDVAKRAERERRITNDRAKRRREEFQISKNAANEQINIAKDFQKQAAEISKNMNFDFFGGTQDNKSSGSRNSAREKDLQEEARRIRSIAIENQILIAEEQKRFFEEQLNNENFSYEARNNALNNFNESSRKIAQLNRDKELNDIKLTDKEIKEGKKVSNEELETIDIEFGNSINSINNDIAAKTIAINKSTQQQIENVRVASNQRQLSILERQRDEELANLADTYNQRGDFSTKAQEQYEQERLDIAHKYALEEIRLAIDQTDQLIKIRKLQGADVTTEEAKLAALRLKYQDEVTKNGEKNADKQIKKEQEKLEKLKEIGLELLEFGKSVSASIFEGNIQRLEKEKTLEDERKNQEIENINESLLTEEQKQERIKVLEVQSEARQKQIDQRIAAERRRQAIVEKAFALGQIAINTAIAVSKVAAQTGIFAPAGIGPIIALGALQAASVLAQPIPQFKDGGTMKKDGFAQFGEVGRELRINPDGTTELTPDRTTIGWVEAGTKFINAHETQKMMAKPSRIDSAGKSWEVNGLIAATNGTASRIEKAVSKLTTPSTVITKGGWHSHTIKTTRLNKYFKRNLR